MEAKLGAMRRKDISGRGWVSDVSDWLQRKSAEAGTIVPKEFLFIEEYTLSTENLLIVRDRKIFRRIVRGV